MVFDPDKAHGCLHDLVSPFDSSDKNPSPICVKTSVFAAICFPPLPGFCYSAAGMTDPHKHLHLSYSSAKSDILHPWWKKRTQWCELNEQLRHRYK